MILDLFTNKKSFKHKTILKPIQFKNEKPALFYCTPELMVTTPQLKYQMLNKI